MDKNRRSSDASYQDNAAVAAESIRSDFSDLISMLERQLANLSDADDRAQYHLQEARAAAERGLKLSRQLIELLRASN